MKNTSDRAMDENESSGYLTDGATDAGAPTVPHAPDNGFTNLRELKREGGGPSMLLTATRYGKRFMLKCLRDEYRGNSFYTAALMKEFQIGMELDHPNIRRTLGMEEIEGLGKTLILEYVDGDTLEAMLDDGRITPRNARKLTAQLAEALRYVHDKQIVHRDLKPGNIMVTHSGETLKLIDFSLSDGEGYTEVKCKAGTPGYMPPEQLDGDQGTVPADARTDIYAFGLIVADIAMATGDVKLRRMAARCASKEPGCRPPSLRDVAVPDGSAADFAERWLSLDSRRLTWVLCAVLAALWAAAAIV